ncbi:hypothetical protein V1L54_28255 [Streptomyces sp. TRM 70361]|uniref:hypothetical protein n=1 Tax=Streptomyces sp. TRM 70361 TaxID=3116553 RepID=UPI002E7B5E21|nr:hypothetical protein [Streptomyces sp. TRM 70361]MEE1943251.1 hypothetical protein [Streptomyces sp. TRM 70361]
MTATTRSPAGTPGAPGSTGATAPRADCTADGEGGIGFDITLPGTAERWDAALLLRLRKSDPEETVRLPLVPLPGGSGDPAGSAGPGGSACSGAPGATVLRATLSDAVRLAEGRWDVFLVLDGGAPRRLLPGCYDLRALVDQAPPPGRARPGVRVPYTTKYGNLSLRTWLREPHAEAGEVWPADGGVTLHGRLYGAELTSGARLEARPRGAAGPLVTAPVDREGTADFTARLAYGDLLREPGAGDEWELWLRPGGDAGPVRIARILDDIIDKHRVIRYPARPVPVPRAGADGEEDGSGTVRARPYYTGANDLSVRLERAARKAS